MITHDSFRLTWTPDGSGDVVQYERMPGRWSSIGQELFVFTSPLDVSTTTANLFSGFVAAFPTYRNPATPLRLRHFTIDDEVSNVVEVRLLQPPGGQEMTGGDDTAADKAVLPRLLHRFNNGIFRRIQQRQREDGKWK